MSLGTNFTLRFWLFCWGTVYSLAWHFLNFFQRNFRSYFPRYNDDRWLLKHFWPFVNWHVCWILLHLGWRLTHKNLIGGVLITRPFRWLSSQRLTPALINTQGALTASAPAVSPTPMEWASWSATNSRTNMLVVVQCFASSITAWGASTARAPALGTTLVVWAGRDAARSWASMSRRYIAMTVCCANWVVGTPVPAASRGASVPCEIKFYL